MGLKQSLRQLFNYVPGHNRLETAFLRTQWQIQEAQARQGWTAAADLKDDLFKQQLVDDHFYILPPDQAGTALNFDLDQIPHAQKVSAYFDQGLIHRVAGHIPEAESIYYRLPEAQFQLVLHTGTQIQQRLAHALGMSFRIHEVVTYRRYPLRGARYQSFLWHIDYNHATPYEYKCMIFLKPITAENGPMLLSDIHLQRDRLPKGGYRFTEEQIQTQAKRITPCVGPQGSAVVFATDLIHQGGQVHTGVRDVIVLSFLPGTAKGQPPQYLPKAPSQVPALQLEG